MLFPTSFLLHWRLTASQLSATSCLSVELLPQDQQNADAGLGWATGPQGMKPEMMPRVIEELQSEVELPVSRAGDQRCGDHSTRIWKLSTGCIAGEAHGIFMYWLTGHEQIRCEDSSRGTKPCRRCR